jgi:hypothetical protein
VRNQSPSDETKTPRGSTPAESSTVLLACPAGQSGGAWFWRWKELVEEWKGGWDTSALKPALMPSWRRRALEQGGARWVVLADPGCAPGAVALFQALQVLALRPRVGCVGLVPPDWLEFLPEIRPMTSSLWIAPFASGGVVVVKGSAVARCGLPEPRFYPCDLAEMTFNMTRKGLEVVLLPDPSFLGPPRVSSIVGRVRDAWKQGRGSAAFRLSHRGQAPRSLRFPKSAPAFLVTAPWLVASVAWRGACRCNGCMGGLGGRLGAGRVGGRAYPQSASETEAAQRAPSESGEAPVSDARAATSHRHRIATPVRAFFALPESLAFVGGALRAYFGRRDARPT